jgi:hypothetical protein
VFGNRCNSSGNVSAAGTSITMQQAQPLASQPSDNNVRKTSSSMNYGASMHGLQQQTIWLMVAEAIITFTAVTTWVTFA